MKKRSKILTIVAALVMCVLMAVGLAGCSGGGSADVEDVYVANGMLIENNDEYGTKIATSTSVVLYTDGTYALIVTSNGYMGAYGNSTVMKGVTISYGTYTLTAEYDDEGTLALTAPTRIVVNTVITSGTPVFYDTDDETTFEGADQTAAEYLAANGKAYTLTVNPEARTITGGLN